MRTALVVDDSPVALRALGRRLTADGIDVVEATSVATAGKVDVAALACAVIDLQLEDGDGPDLAAALLARRADLPVAFFTSAADASLVGRARALGPVFMKPDLDAIAAWVTRTATAAP
jgi:two-component system response regulator RegA